MEYTLDTDPSDSEINEVRAGLIKHNTPFLEGIPKSQVGYYAMKEGVRSVVLLRIFGETGY